ncbi:hypothetical protein CPB83DRAFT_864345 [Crepidotus variabilis]|uniref:Pheromone n=1 Tax=Crepidotus variabilis TaxID=179855 RepID=A0A9P6E4P3_9AGAR|nr:hypothetical protein CPB83DRAFT_864345 [Crepidotus variabilis]
MDSFTSFELMLSEASEAQIALALTPTTKESSEDFMLGTSESLPMNFDSAQAGYGNFCVIA